MRRVSERERAIQQFVTLKKTNLRIHSYYDNVMTKFMINNRTDALKTDVNLLIDTQMKTALVGLLFVC